MESSLADTYWDIIAAVGFDQGWGQGAHFGDEAWTADKERTLKRVVKGGLQQFYNPPVDQSGVSHQWSFLKPLVSVTILSGEQTVLMPFDFKGLVGPVYVMTGNGIAPSIIEKSGNVRASYAVFPSESGRPARIEIEPIKGTEKDRGQRFRMAVFPLPDADYEFQFHHSIQGDMLNGSRPYAYGGAEHSNTIIASCLAYAEIHLEDIANGPKQMYWRERLAASISMDREKRPDTFGYNGDSSDQRSVRGYSREMQSTWGPITYNGDSID